MCVTVTGVHITKCDCVTILIYSVSFWELEGVQYGQTSCFFILFAIFLFPCLKETVLLQNCVFVMHDVMHDMIYDMMHDVMHDIVHGVI